jgi:hypothetical protein
MILQAPAAIFRGLCREQDEPSVGYGGLCYTGVPPTAYRKDGTEVEPWKGEVLLVFVSDEMVAYNWYWTKADPENPALQENYTVRFKERAL